MLKLKLPFLENIPNDVNYAKEIAQATSTQGNPFLVKNT